MKVTAAISVLAFVAVQAAAVPEAKVHARDASAEPGYRLKNYINFCGVPGQACGRKREAEAEADPKRRYRLKNYINFCGVPGQACGKARDAPETEVGNELGYCTSPGEPCAQIKRSANAIAEAIAEAEADPKKYRLKNYINFCGVPGQACGKARSLTDTVVEHTNDVYGAIAEREAEALPEAEADASADPEARRRRRKYRLKNYINFCGVPGQACGRRRDAPELTEKIKRDAEALALPEAEADASADPEARRRRRKYRLKNYINFCGVPGQACGKARNAEAVADAMAKADPTIFRNTCFAEGGECDTLLKIQKAFHQSKQEAAAEKALSPEAKLAHCGGKNECTALAHAHQYAKQRAPRDAAEEEKRCNGPDGLCTLAARDLAGLEATIDSAVEEMIASNPIDVEVDDE